MYTQGKRYIGTGAQGTSNANKKSKLNKRGSDARKSAK